jgi:hypothetical protein
MVLINFGAAFHLFVIDRLFPFLAPSMIECILSSQPSMSLPLPRRPVSFHRLDRLYSFYLSFSFRTTCSNDQYPLYRRFSFSTFCIVQYLGYNRVEIMLVNSTCYFNMNTFIYHFGYIYLGNMTRAKKLRRLRDTCLYAQT